MRRKRFLGGGLLNIANLVVVDVLGTAIRPTNFVLVRLKVSVKEE